jgi:hypothetical protein
MIVFGWQEEYATGGDLVSFVKRWSGFDELDGFDEKSFFQSARELFEGEMVSRRATDGPVVAELELFDPGPESFEWLEDDPGEVIGENNGGGEAGEGGEAGDGGFRYLTEEEVRGWIEAPGDPLYLVKWRNLSYLQSTWEPSSCLSGAT